MSKNLCCNNISEVLTAVTTKSAQSSRLLYHVVCTQLMFWSNNITSIFKERVNQAWNQLKRSASCSSKTWGSLQTTKHYSEQLFLCAIHKGSTECENY